MTIPADLSIEDFLKADRASNESRYASRTGISAPVSYCGECAAHIYLVT
jgi:hypothetical protein